MALPKLPDPDNLFSAIDKAGSVIDKGLGLIDKVSDRLDKIGLTEEPRAPETVATPPESHTAGATPGVSDKDTLLYQLNHLLAVLSQLEIHLSEDCKIMGVPCDCCGKHAVQASTFAMETIPIAARMDKETNIYQDIASWAPLIEEIDTPEKVNSGDYDEAYRKESGTASKFRKKVQSMIAELKGGADDDCPGCEEMRETISSFIEKRKRGGGRG
ncbi:hypothetical protein ES705_25784 [subsurface metagenome]